MIGPPLRKLSTKKFPAKGPWSGVAEGLAFGEADAPVAGDGTPAAVEGVMPGTGERPGAVALGTVPIGEIPGAVAAGMLAAGAPEAAVAGGTTAGVAFKAGSVGAPGRVIGVVPGAGGFCASAVNASVIEQRDAVSSVFIMAVPWRRSY